MRKKELYAAPETEVLELAFEQAILDGSTTDPDLGDPGLGGGGWN